jgi:hypothetical protein
VPETYDTNSEWKVFLVAIHEFVHSASYHGRSRLGIEDEQENPDLEEINEAVTDIVTFLIANEHLAKSKTAVSGQIKGSIRNLDDMPYQFYIQHLKPLFRKINPQVFIDAMLNEDGFDRLLQVAEKELGSKEALIKLGETMRDLYNPHKKPLPDNVIPFKKMEV